MNQKPSKKGFYAALIGVIVIALCCFTSILVVTLGVVGLSAFTPNLDYILWPALILLIIIAWLSYRKYYRASQN